VFFIKKIIDDYANNVDLVRQMQHGSDLENA
jgi:hypothetical protein